jgi:thiol-disulfide isomerase/thioredoxin
MKKGVGLLGLVVVIGVGVGMTATARAEAAAAPRWMVGSLADAQAEAAASGRWVLVDVYADWCAPCQELDERVFSREAFWSVVAPAFVAFKVNGEAGEGPELVGRYHVVGFPTLLLLDEKGREVERVMGGATGPAELGELLVGLKKGKGTVAALEARLAQKPDDEALRLELGVRHAMRGDARCLDELAQVVKADPDNRSGRAAQALLVLGKYYHLRGRRDAAAAEATLRELMTRFPGSAEAAQAPYHLAVALAWGRKPGAALEVLDRWVAEDPADVSRYASYAWFTFKEGVEPARGVEVAKRGLKLDAKDHGLWDTLGELQLVIGQAREARAAFARALALKPESAYYRAQVRRLERK